jgi:branched-chain amino acid transport system substrate-binding protein
MNTGKMAVALVLGALALSASAASERPSDGVYADHIDWGVMMDMSGPASAAQLPWVNGFQAYMKKVNDAGGVNGRKINVLAEDDRYDAATDRANYEKLVNQTPVLGISGFGNSSAQVALLPTVRKGKVPIVGTYVTPKSAVEPPTPLYYGAFCGFREMAQTGIGFLSDLTKAKAPTVAVVHLDVASGKEYFDYVDADIKKRGGTAKSIPIKVAAADATPQVLEVVNMKPDFVAIHGVPTTSILVMRAMKQYGLKTPTFAITYLGTPGVYDAIGPETGANYYFVSCFTPASVDDTAGVKDMSAVADKYGYGKFKDDVNFVAGYVVAQLVADAVAKAGPDVTREKLVESMSKGFEVDTKGVSAPLKYTKDDHLGLVVLRPYGYDYTGKKFKAYGKYSDYEKFVK